GPGPCAAARSSRPPSGTASATTIRSWPGLADGGRGRGPVERVGLSSRATPHPGPPPARGEGRGGGVESGEAAPRLVFLRKAGVGPEMGSSSGWLAPIVPGVVSSKATTHPTRWTRTGRSRHVDQATARGEPAERAPVPGPDDGTRKAGVVEE